MKCEKNGNSSVLNVKRTILGSIGTKKFPFFGDAEVLGNDLIILQTENYVSNYTGEYNKDINRSSERFLITPSTNN